LIDVARVGTGFWLGGGFTLISSYFKVFGFFEPVLVPLTVHYNLPYPTSTQTFISRAFSSQVKVSFPEILAFWRDLALRRGLGWEVDKEVRVGGVW